jgi:HTH-type transcriptional regulator/antitoxin HigA
MPDAMSPDPEPRWVVNPGETLRETLKERGMTGTALAESMGVSPPYVSELLAGHKMIGPVTALKLEGALGISAEFWMRLWVPWSLKRERARLARRLAATPTEEERQHEPE